MLMEEKFIVKAPIAKVWDFVLDPEKMGSCVPGCEKIEKIDDRTYDTVVKAGVGPIHVKFKFRTVLTEMEYPTHLHAQGGGADVSKAGSFQQDSDFDMREISENEVEISYKSNVSVSGRLATFGERIMRMKARDMGNKFAEAMKKKIEAEQEGNNL